MAKRASTKKRRSARRSQANKPSSRKAGSKRPRVATRRPKKTRRKAADEAPTTAALKPPPVANVRAEFAATAAGCLDQEVATALVFSCTGVGPVDPATLLGTLFPSDVQRRGFCGCVFNKAVMAGANVEPADIPCVATASIGDVIDRISC